MNSIEIRDYATDALVHRHDSELARFSPRVGVELRIHGMRAGIVPVVVERLTHASATLWLVWTRRTGPRGVAAKPYLRPGCDR